jgi:hypothetical protein
MTRCATCGSRARGSMRFELSRLRADRDLSRDFCIRKRPLAPARPQDNYISRLDAFRDAHVRYSITKPGLLDRKVYIEAGLMIGARRSSATIAATSDQRRSARPGAAE